MKLKELFDFFVAQGIEKDPRGISAVQAYLKDEESRFAKLSADEKDFFDSDRLRNPYADSRILSGTGDEPIKALMVGIDIETPELLLAETLRARGKKIDAVLTHHPEGRAYANFYKVMDMQADIMHLKGVPINVAESLVGTRLKEVGRKVMPQNHTRSADAAALLGLPFLAAHTPADNQVTDFLAKLFDSRKPKNLGEIVKILKEIPEYREAAVTGAGPKITAGSEESRPGKIFVDMTGGTEGPKDALEKLAQAGVGTIVGMHMSEDHFKDAQKHHLNVIIAGHISSDNLGVNLLLDAAEKKFGSIDTIACSGFRRFKR